MGIRYVLSCDVRFLITSSYDTKIDTVQIKIFLVCPLVWSYKVVFSSTNQKHCPSLKISMTLHHPECLVRSHDLDYAIGRSVFYRAVQSLFCKLATI